ncbi:Plasmodium exported protein (Pm-fam-a like), unknown function [Plasmodium malariae]|uniref:Fam-m protein n=1 Tax=Plasmodium malariae TaxID=5858 RepID=A0A1A8WYY8_PLAMA|nr:Plasmodium exported protein (Pm-fam-a like), unknown function [Plasmodium malariae]
MGGYFCNGMRLVKRNYRSLAIDKQCKHSNNVCVKEKIENNAMNNKKYIYTYGKGDKKTNKHSNRSFPIKAQYYTEIEDYSNGMFDGKHFHFQKKWIKKKDYNNFVEKNRKICDISLEKIKFRSYGFGFFLFFLFLVLGIGIPISPVLSSLLYASEEAFNKSVLGTICTWILEKLSIVKNDLPYFFVVLFVILMVMLSVILIISLYKIIINNEKYNKFNLMRE